MAAKLQSGISHELFPRLAQILETKYQSPTSRPALRIRFVAPKMFPINVREIPIGLALYNLYLRCETTPLTKAIPSVKDSPPLVDWLPVPRDAHQLR
jgi:hypothetical protein